MPEAPRKVTLEQLWDKLEELEDLQLLEKLNSIEIREELQNLHRELDSLGINPEEHKANISSAPEGKLSELEDKLAEMEQKITQAGLQTPQDMKEQLAEVEQKIQSLGKVVPSGAGVDVSQINKILEERLRSLPAANGEVDYNLIMKYVEETVNKKFSESQPKTGFFKKAAKPEVDTDYLKSEISKEVHEQLSSLKLPENPAQVIADKKLDKKLKELKSDIVDSMPHLESKMIEKRFGQAFNFIDKMDERVGKIETQMSSVLTSVPREIKGARKEMEEYSEVTERILDTINRDLKEMRKFTVEKAESVSEHEVRRMLDDKYVEMKNEILARDLSDSNMDSRFASLTKRVEAIDNNLKSLKFEMGDDIAKVKDLENFKDQFKVFEDYMNTQLRDKLSVVKPEILDQMLRTLNELRNRVDRMETGTPQGAAKAIDDLRAKEEADRRDIEKILLIMKSELDRIHMSSRDMQDTVLEKLEKFEKTIPEAELAELNKLRIKMIDLEANMRKLTQEFKSKSSGRPTIIE